MTRCAWSFAVVLLLSSVARGDVAPPDQCSTVGATCNTAGTNFDEAGVCINTTCTRQTGSGPMDYACMRCRVQTGDMAGATTKKDEGCNASGAATSSAAPFGLFAVCAILAAAIFGRRRAAARISTVIAIVGLCGIAEAREAKPKPEKLPVAFGKWTGKGNGSFKGVLRSKINKECVVVPVKKARVLIEGEVIEKEPPSKAVSVKLVVKSTKTGEVVETKEFQFPRPSPSAGQMARMAKATVEITRRAPTDQ